MRQIIPSFKQRGEKLLMFGGKKEVKNNVLVGNSATSFLIFILSQVFLSLGWPVKLRGTLDVLTITYPTIHIYLPHMHKHAQQKCTSYTYIFIIFTIGLFCIMLQFPFFLFSQIFLNLKQTKDTRWHFYHLGTWNNIFWFLKSSK